MTSISEYYRDKTTYSARRRYFIYLLPFFSSDVVLLICIVRNIIYGSRENNTAETINQQKDKKISYMFH
ncbi:MAG TPA: hypothetical protein VE573_19255, partial [Nitrososphaeraceae archaeon]|nr:hypothetical protein [Nitrososphaeraceae archaeon]